MKNFTSFIIIFCLVVSIYHYRKGHSTQNAVRENGAVDETYSLTRSALAEFRHTFLDHASQAKPGPLNQTDSGLTQNATQGRATEIQHIRDYIERQNIVERMNKGQLTDIERDYVVRIYRKLSQLQAEDIRQKLSLIEKDVREAQAQARR